MNAPPTLELAVGLKLGELRHGTTPTLEAMTLVDVVAVVLTLHRNEYGTCQACGNESAVSWPCDTVKVVAGALGLKEGDWR